MGVSGGGYCRMLWVLKLCGMGDPSGKEQITGTTEAEMSINNSQKVSKSLE